MIPTTLPTDNFYKFITFLGILICGLSIYGIVQVFSTTNTEIKAFAEEFRRSEPTTRQYEMSTQITKKRKEVMSSDIAFLEVFTVVGLVIFTVGVILWYLRHQVHLDRMIELERAKVDPEYAKKITPVQNPAQETPPDIAVPPT